ncbi:hypothetical protein GF373_07590, partial [bacterium]|nr:hypothetical protein [bacterium]
MGLWIRGCGMNDRIEEKAPKRRRGRSLWGMAWERFKRNPRGMVGLFIVLLLALIAFLSPLLANRQPIVCQYEGEWYFPGIVEVIQNIPFASILIKKSPPFSRATFDAKRSLSKEDFAIWPLVPYGPTETSAKTLQPPSANHWLGTDQNGRDVLARMVYGTIVSIQVGLIS